MNAKLRIAPGDVTCFSFGTRDDSTQKPMLIASMDDCYSGGTDVVFIDAGATCLDSLVTLDAHAWQFRKLL